MQSMLRGALKKRDFFEDAVILAKAATISASNCTGTSLFQFPTKAVPGESISIPPSGRQQHSLPDSYAMVTQQVLYCWGAALDAAPQQYHRDASNQPRWSTSQGKRVHAMTLIEKEELASEDALCRLHTMLHNYFLYKTLQQCVHYCLFSMLPLQW